MSLERSFLKICLFFAVFLTVILSLAIFGYFYETTVGVAVALFLAASLFVLVKSLIRIDWKRLNKTHIACFVIIVTFVLFIGYFHHDLPTARDELSFIYAADRLTVSGSLAWEDYFTRPMHGVRNLGNDVFTSQFLPVYTSYLAAYKLFGGLEILLWANALLMLLTFGIFYYLAKNLVHEKASLLTIIFLLSAYVFFWFPKRTNVENISIFLIWLGVWLAVKSIKSGKPVYLLSGLMPFSLLTVTRPEGLIFLTGYSVITVILLIFKFKKDIFKNLLINLSVVLLSIANLLLFYFYIQFFEARYIFTQLVDVLEGFGFIYSRPALMITTAVVIIAALIAVIKMRRWTKLQTLICWLITLAIMVFEALFFIKASQGKLTWEVYRSQYVLENFAYYLYFIYTLIVLIGLRKKIFTSLEFIIAVILLPSFFFIIEPNIALDQPWFMRRFYPNLIPFFIILSAVVISRLYPTKRQLKYIIISAILIGLITTRSIFFFVEHRGLKDQIEEFNKTFPKEALIVMNPGWSWQKIAIIQHYFYGYNALPNIDLYLPEEYQRDLPQTIKQYPDWKTDNNDLIAIINWEKNKSEEYFVELVKRYSEVYVVTMEKNSSFFPGFKDQNLVLMDDFTFKFKELRKESSLTQYIQQNKIIDLSNIRKQQNYLPPNTIDKQTIELNIFKVIDNQEYIPIKYVLSADEIQPDNHVYFVLKDVDLNAYRQKLQDRVSANITDNE